jgi:hypothetical protein
MHLGFDPQSGLVYEGFSAPERPVVPTPTVTQAKLIERQEDWADLPSGLFQSASTWMFRDDTFDAVTRTRRGRLYVTRPGLGQPSMQRVVAHPYEDPFGRSARTDGTLTKNLFTYVACTDLLNKPHQGLGMTLALGQRRAPSVWRIVQSELLASECVLVTLKALTAYGLLPELDLAKVDAPFRAHVSQAIQRVLDSAFRETPISVIDQCRNAMAVLISRWLVQQGDDKARLKSDLGDLANAVSKSPHDLNCVGNAARIIARLHARGKDNERISKDLRPPQEEDAALALETLGFVVRDLGWAVA